MKVLILTLLALAGTIHAADTVFSTILSGSGQDYATAVASDAQGNTYVAGLTYSPDFPVTAGAYQTKFGLTCDAFIAKVGPDGKLIWATYLGGILDDFATGVALDKSGNVWVTGWTRSANFPLVNPIQSTLDGGASDDFDAFVAEFDPTGAKLLFSTFLGGAADDGGASIAAGEVVTGAPPTWTLPVVTVGGMEVPVVSSVLATGTAGLYQITIQLPASVPTGSVAIQASIDGVPTQAGVTILVASQ